MREASRTEGRSVVLVGVAGVGKTALGALAAERLGFPFIDVEVGYETETGLDIDSLLERYGDEGYNERSLQYLFQQLENPERVVIAATPRLMNHRTFWPKVRSTCVSIHLRGKPMEVYMRQDSWLGKRRLTREEKLTAAQKAEFYDYYYWRLRHCQKADLTVRIVGDIDADADAVSQAIESVLSAECHDNCTAPPVT